MERSGENSAGQGTSKKENENSCYVCLEKFESKSHLNWHEISIHENPKNFKCSYCDETAFDSKSAFLKHRKSHVKKEPSICQTCGKKFKWPSALGYHMNTHTAKVPRDCEILSLENCVENKFNSTDINQGTTNTLNENVHNYSCDICLENFVSESHLLLHEIHVHENTKNYKCLDCNATYASKRSLALHRKVHFRPFPCQNCPKRFASNWSLIQHKGIHTGSKPFECNDCGKSFRFLYGLRIHALTVHHGLNPYKCSICNKEYSSRTGIRGHVRRNRHYDSALASEEIKQQVQLKNELVTESKDEKNSDKDEPIKNEENELTIIPMAVELD